MKESIGPAGTMPNTDCVEKAQRPHHGGRDDGQQQLTAERLQRDSVEGRRRPFDAGHQLSGRAVQAGQDGADRKLPAINRKLSGFFALHAQPLESSQKF